MKAYEPLQELCVMLTLPKPLCKSFLHKITQKNNYFHSPIIANDYFHTCLTEALFHALCEQFRSPNLTIKHKDGTIRQVNGKQSRYNGVSSIFFKIFAGCRPHHINNLPQSREKAVVTCYPTSSLQPFHSIFYFYSHPYIYRNKCSYIKTNNL